MGLKVDVICPYCGLSRELPIDILNPANKIIGFCEPEEGGCDKYFVYDARLEVNVNTYCITPKTEEKE